MNFMEFILRTNNNGEELNMRDGDILTNRKGTTCIYTIKNGVEKLTDVDKVGEFTGNHIQEYIQQHGLKITDHWDNHVTAELEGF